MDADAAGRYQREAALYRQLGVRFLLLRQKVKEILAGSVRDSSVVENLNSRLRNYFFLRRSLGFVTLWRLILNHAKVQPKL